MLDCVGLCWIVFSSLCGYFGKYVLKVGTSKWLLFGDDDWKYRGV